MNRWSKYGGILPETVNISEMEYIPNYIINDSGRITNNDYGHISSYIYLLPGKYKLKLISTNSLSTNFYFRVHQYDLDRVWKKMLLKYISIAPTPVDKIWTVEITITEPSYIRFSINAALSLVEIEKL